MCPADDAFRPGRVLRDSMPLNAGLECSSRKFI